MKSKLMTMAGALALFGVLGHFYAKPLLAQVRAALTANIDEPARTAFQMTFNGTCPPDSCFVQTNPVPAGKRLHVTHISSSSNVAFTMVLASHAPRTVVGNFISSAGPGNTNVVNSVLDFYLDSGEYLETFFTANNNALNNTVTGYLVDCTAATCAPIVRQ